MAHTTLPNEHTRPPFWRDERVLAIIAQIIFLLVVVVTARYLFNNAREGLAQAGLTPGYDFLRLRAGFDIGDTIIPYTSDDTYARAFLVGIVNTVRVALIGIALATILGTVMGILRLSPNLLLRGIATVYVETIRNTPLLVQLFFWYTAVMLKFPRVRQAIVLPGPMYLSNRGLAIPWIEPLEGFRVWLGFFVAAFVIAYIVYRIQWAREDRTGQTSYPITSSIIAWLVIVVAGWFLAPGQPFGITRPELAGLNFTGGTVLAPEFAALLIGLVVYTGAFIAEIVRAGIQAVDKGQREAATALGLSTVQSLRFVILPQAMRIIIPPMTSQYLNLTKNSSLAFFIGFPDLFAVSTTIQNQTGKALEVISIVMACYLTTSLLTSLFMNWYNQKVRLVER